MGRLYRSVAIISAIFSLVQGLIWVILAILTLLTYTCSLYQDKYPAGHYKDFLNSYFQGSRCSPNYNLFQCVDSITRPETLVIWTSFILAANFLLVITSLMLISVIVTIKSRAALIWLYAYLFFCLFVIVLDIGFTSVISKDTTAAMNSTCLPYNEIGALTLLSLAIITSKGIILWVANICFFLFLSIVGLTALKTGSSMSRKCSTTASVLSSDFTVPHSSAVDLDQPIKVVKACGTPVPVPEHSALGRWPCLIFNSKLAPVSRSDSDVIVHRQRQPLQFETFQAPQPVESSPIRTPPPLKMPPPKPAPIHQLDPPRRDYRQTNQFRPNSLEEAIRTIPLRHTNSPYVIQNGREN